MKRTTLTILLALCTSPIYADVNALGDSAYSKAGPNSAQTNCNWSPNHGFLVCDQIVHLPDGATQNDLSIYTYNETDHSYAFYGLFQNNSRVRTPKLTIEDKRWSYSGEFEDNGKKIRFRTINDFTTPATVTFRPPAQNNCGAGW